MNAVDYITARGRLQTAIRWHEQRVRVLHGKMLSLQEEFQGELKARFVRSVTQPQEQLQLEDRK